MISKFKNIIIFVGVGLAIVLVYVFFIRQPADESNLVSSTPSTATSGTTPGTADSLIGQDFLGLLLNVKNIKLDDSIFSDPAFLSLHDSSILLIPDGNEGRPNPFAPIGTDVLPTPAPVVTPTTPTTTTPAATTTPATPTRTTPTTTTPATPTMTP